MITKRGIYHNIEESSVYLVIDKYTLYFSSDTNKGRFVGKYDEYYSKVNTRLKRIYELDYLPLILISLYKIVEKRCFRVYYKNRRIAEEFIRIEV